MYDRSLLARSIAGKIEVVNHERSTSTPRPAAAFPTASAFARRRLANRVLFRLSRAILAAMAVTLVLTAVRFWPRPSLCRAHTLHRQRSSPPMAGYCA